MNKPWIFLLLAVTTLHAQTACNNTPNDEQFLTQPPYKALTDSIRATPANASYYFDRGILLLQNKDSTHALKDFRKAWQLNRQPKYAFILSEYWLQHQQPDSAIALLHPLVQADPGNQFLQRNLLTAYFNKQQFAQALRINDAALAHDSLSSGNWYNRAMVQDALKDSAAALLSMEQALHLDPNNSTIAYELANRYADAGNPRTLRLTDFLLQTDSLKRSAELFTIQGIYYKNNHDIPNALTTFDRAIRADYTFMDAYLQKGILLYQQKKYKDALKVFDLSTSVSNTFADGYFWIGRCQEAEGQTAEAKRNYQRAIACDQSFIEARTALARVTAAGK